MYVFLSPHFDDAIGSASGLISRFVQNRKSVKIITIMGGIPKSIQNKQYVLERQRENQKVCEFMGVPHISADFLDAIYRTDEKNKLLYQEFNSIFNAGKIIETNLIKDVATYIETVTDVNDILFVPCANGNHIDHRIVKKAAEKVNRKIIYYEDFFYDTISIIKKRKMYPIVLSPDELNKKIEAVLMYKTQIASLFKDEMGVKQYFLCIHTQNGSPVERFSSVLKFD